MFFIKAKKSLQKYLKKFRNIKKGFILLNQFSAKKRIIASALQMICRYNNRISKKSLSRKSLSQTRLKAA